MTNSLGPPCATAVVAVASALLFACSSEREDRSLAPALPTDGPIAPPACRDGRAPPYPRAEQRSPAAVGDVVSDLAFEGVDERGARATIRMNDYFDPCASESRLLVVRVHGGAWCGTCLWHGEHTSALTEGALGKRLRVVDLVVGDEDNAPARPEDAAAWRARLGAHTKVAVGADPDFRLRSVGKGQGIALPLTLFVDARTMKLMAFAANPSPYELDGLVTSALATLDGRSPSPRPREALFDAVFHENEREMIEAMALPRGGPPPDPTNAFADDARAAALGKALFFDAGLSSTGAVSCATCHDPDKQLADGRARAVGVAEGDRRSPPIALAAWSRWQFWDGRADSLWSQALGPFENDREMASSRVAVVRRLATTHQAAYAEAFPSSPLPDLSLVPDGGRPGDPRFDALEEATRDTVARAFVNAGKSIAAYERTFRVEESALDRYARGDRSALSADEKVGLAGFFRSGCAQCHWGPRLTDDAFHVTRFPTGRRDGAADRGRIDGIVEAATSEFSAGGKWSDAPDRRRSHARLTAAPSMLGAFRTPTLRGVARATHLTHGGAFVRLSDVTESYGVAGLAAGDHRAVGVAEPWLPLFGETTQWAIVRFLETLTAEPIVSR